MELDVAQHMEMLAGFLGKHGSELLPSVEELGLNETDVFMMVGRVGSVIGLLRTLGDYVVDDVTFPTFNAMARAVACGPVG